MSQVSGPGASAVCNNCGAPDNGELVICRFCQQAVSAEALRTAIPCPNPQCRAQCRWGKQKCAHCQAWIVVSCVFCGAISPHNVSNCMRCNEAFAGAAQRKMMHEQQRQEQQNMQQASVWGNVAASFLGAATGVALGEAFESHDSCSSSDDDVGDISDVSDDTPFDFGGGDD
jgi:hypothetical protein